MAKTIHGHTCWKNGNAVMSHTYITWNSMKQRCYNEKHEAYDRYYGKGITVCERWKNSFANFLEDMGVRPKGLTLDRIDPTGNYEPENCKWSTPKEQANNCIKSYVPFNGKIWNINDLIKKYKLTYSTFRSRINRGKTLKEALEGKKKLTCDDFKDAPDINRKYQIRWFRNKGITLEEIGKHYGLTRERIRQILL